MPERERGQIGLGLATVLVASNMVGSGIFLLPASLAQIGSLTTLGWLLATGGALLIARVLGRLGAHAPASGGACTYVGRALGPYMGFQASAVYWVACWTGNVAIAVAAIGYLTPWAPALRAPAALAGAAIALIWLLTGLNFFGARRVCQLESASLLLGLVPVAIVVGGGVWHFEPRLFAASWNVTGEPAWRALPPSLVLTFWAFAGVESASIATAVVRDPERNVARATYLGVCLAALVYLAACGILMGLMPASALARSSAPFADAVRLLFGPAAAALVALMAVAKATGSLGGWILLTVQTGEAGATHGFFPRFFARRNRRGVAVANLLLAGVLMSGGVLATLSATLGEQFGKLISVSVILAMLLYIYACVAILHYARRSPEAFGRDRIYAAAGLVFCAVVVLCSGLGLLEVTAAVVALTVPLYPLCRRAGRAPAAEAGQAVS